ncbi:MAG: hypothetical protein ABR611_07985 [Chthoniobacterales bacterium]
MKLSRLLPAIALLGFIFPGCSATTKTTATSTTTLTAKRDAKLFVVSVESTPFFRHGPQAGRDPDGKLSKETVLKLIRPSFGYSKVEIAATGEQGYVSSEDIRPASSNLIASASAPKVDPLATPSTTPAVEQFNLNSDDPRLVPPPEALPPAELPAPAPSPEP